VKVVIFSDLDGTILDKEYSFHKIKSTITHLKSLNADIVLCSSKTRLEIESYRKEMNLDDPFISENGGAIFVPKNFLKKSEFTKKTKKYDIIEFGTKYRTLRQKIKKIALIEGCRIVGFGDMTVKEVAKDTGLSLKMAKLAKKREYDEPLLMNHNEKNIIEAATQEDLRVTKGDGYFHLSGQHNKGEAVACLKLLYIKNFKQVYTIGVGNGPSDESLMTASETSFYIEENESRERTWKRILKEVKKIQKPIS
jgi:mannosyl-3-phosphoglycerate phosphatase